MLDFPVNFTFLGFQIIGLLDRGIHVPLETVGGWIRDGDLFDRLDGLGCDLSPYAVDDRERLVRFFGGHESVGSPGAFAVSSNGIALLVAYCFEGIQEGPNALSEYA